MKTTFRVLAYFIAFLVALQASWIAWAVFAIGKDLDEGKVIDKNYEGVAGWWLHPVFGEMVIPLLIILLLVFSYFVKVKGISKASWVIFGVLVLQILWAYLAFLVHPSFGILHGLNAFVLFRVLIESARKVKLDDSVIVSPVL